MIHYWHLESSHQPVRQLSSTQDVRVRQLWRALWNRLSNFNVWKDDGGTAETTAAPGAIVLVSDRCLDPLGHTPSCSTSNKGRSLGTPAADPQRWGQLPEIGLWEPTPTWPGSVKTWADPHDLNSSSRRADKVTGSTQTLTGQCVAHLGTITPSHS